MARDYAKKLTLQDNFTEVCKKAANEMKKLITVMDKVENKTITPKVDDKAVKTLEKDMAKLNKNQIAVRAKLNSSVYSTMNAVNKAIVPNKTIHITAKDDLTRTVTNLERNIFTMQNRLKGSFKAPFSNFNTSAKSAIATTAALSSVLRGLTGGDADSEILGPLLGGAAAGKMLACNKGTDVAAIAAALGRPAPVSPGKYKPGLFSGLRAGWADAVTSAKNHKNGYVEDADVLKQLPGVSNAWDNDSRFAQMIAHQKASMSKLGGSSNYLKKYQPKELTMQIEDYDENGQPNPYDEIMFSGIIKSKNKAQRAIENIRTSMINLANTAQSKLTGAFNKVWDSKFVTKARNAFNSVSTFAQRTGLRIGNAFERGQYYAANAIAKLVTKASNIGSKIKAIALKINDNPVVKGLKDITSKVGKLAGKTFKFTMNMAGNALKGLGGILGGVAKGVGGLALGGLALAGTGLTKGVMGASSLEQNQVSMAHFIGVANGKGSNDASTQKATTDYMAQLNKFANKTPFSNAEVMDAGRRAVNVSGGDTGAAMDLTKLAGDMAALNPGKSVMDAMEALADLKNGETERMKEFGFKISAKDIEKAGGAEAYFKSQTSGSGAIGKQFAGGADKLSGTAAGQWSTLTGNAESTLSKFGSKILPALTEGLGGINQWFDDNEKIIDAWVDAFGKGFSQIVTFIKPAFGFIKDVFKGIGTGIGQFVTVFKTYVPQIQQAVQPIITTFTNMFNKVGSGGIDMTGVFNHIAQVITTVVQIVSPVIAFMGELIGRIMKTVGKRIGVVTNIIGDLCKIWQDIWPIIQSVLETAWSIIEPIFNTLMSVAQIIADIFMLIWPGIKDAIQDLWDFISPIFDLMSKALEGISKFAGWVADKLHGVVSGKDDAEEAASNINEDGSRKAVGISYVPRNDFFARLHEGERVLSKDEAQNYGKGSGGSYPINININGSNKDSKEIAREVVQELNRAVLNKGGKFDGVPA